MSNDFLPEGYEVPKDEKYLRIKDIKTYKIRILSSPLLGWLDWKDNKPLRFAMDKKPQAPVNPEQQIRHFWAMPIWNYEKNRIQIFEITQKSIMDAITGYVKTEEFGSPVNYDIKINHLMENGKHKYTVQALPPTILADNIKSAYIDADLQMQELFTGGDPFKNTSF